MIRDLDTDPEEYVYEYECTECGKGTDLGELCHRCERKPEN